MQRISILLAGALLAPAVSALDVVYVTDATNDTVWRCADQNSDGDYNDAGEVAALYSDALGVFVLTNNVGIRSGADGTVHVSDTSEDSIFAFRDFNGDNDAQDDGESWRYFDGRAGGNLSGILLPASNNLIDDPTSGAWYAASANSGAVGVDSIVRTIDLNGDGDANDLGEASEYWTRPGTPGGDSLPQAVVIGPDGNLYIAENPTSGALFGMKGIYKLTDLNADNDANDAGEFTPYFVPTFAAQPFYWCVDVGADGWFYTIDTGNDLVWRFRDMNSDGDAHDAGEANVFWTVGATSNIWDLAIALDGSFYLTEQATPQRLVRLVDADANGTITAGENLELYNETISSTIIGNGRGIDIARAPAPGLGFCFGDGTGGVCPCAAGTAGKGCANSLFASGGRLEGNGSASVALDTVQLVGRFLPNSSCLYFQGTAQVNGGFGAVFGDGLRCAGGAVIRLGTKVNVANTSRYPELGDLSVSVRGVVSSGSTHTYQAWYRNADPVFCTSDTFNLTNGVQITWQP